MTPESSTQPSRSWVSEVVSLDVYVDPSANNPKRFPPKFVAFMCGVGRNRVMFGSNYPMPARFECLAGADGLGLAGEAKALYLAELTRTDFRI